MMMWRIGMLQQDQLQKLYSRYINKLIKCNEHSAKTLLYLIAYCPVLPEHSLRQIDMISVHSQSRCSSNSKDLKNAGRYMLLSWLSPDIEQKYEETGNDTEIQSPYSSLEHYNPRLLATILFAMTVESTKKCFSGLLDCFKNDNASPVKLIQIENLESFGNFIKDLETLILETSLALPANQRINADDIILREAPDISVRDVDDLKRKVHDVFLIGQSGKILEILNENGGNNKLPSPSKTEGSIKDQSISKCKLSFGQMKILLCYLDIEMSGSQSMERKGKTSLIRISSVLQNLIIGTVALSSRFFEEGFENSNLINVNRLDSASEFLDDWKGAMDEFLKCKLAFKPCLSSCVKPFNDLYQSITQTLTRLIAYEGHQKELLEIKRKNSAKKSQKQLNDFDEDFDDDVGFIDDNHSRNFDSDTADSILLAESENAIYTEMSGSEIFTCIRKSFLVLCRIRQCLIWSMPISGESHEMDSSEEVPIDIKNLEVQMVDALLKFLTAFTDETQIHRVLKIIFETINILCTAHLNDGTAIKLSFEAMHQVICLLQEVGKRTISAKKFDCYAMSNIICSLKLLLPHLHQPHLGENASEKKNFMSFVKRIISMQKNSDYQRYSLNIQLQLADLFGAIAPEDPLQTWSKWSGRYYNMCSQDDGECTIGLDEETGISISILRFINHSSHLIRLRAAKAVIMMFKINRDAMDKQIMQQKKREFAGLHAILMHLVKIEFKDGCSDAFAKDETDNRIGTVMSSLSPIALVCPYLERETIVGLILLHKSAHVHIEALTQVLMQLATYHLESQSELKHRQNILKQYLEPNLDFILKEYFDQGYPLSEFPYQLFGFEDLQNFVTNYESIVVTTLLWCCSTGQEESSLNELLKLMPSKKNAQDILSSNFAAIHSMYVPVIAARTIQPEMLTMQGGRAIDLAKTESLDSLLTEKLPDKVFQSLVSETMPEVLASVLKQIYDPEKISSGQQNIGALLMRPNLPTTNESLVMNVFRYYDSTLPEKIPLLGFLSSDRFLPDCVQRIVTKILEPLKRSSTGKEFSSQIQSLHGLKLFVRRLTQEVSNENRQTNLENQLPFLMWFISTCLSDLIYTQYVTSDNITNRDALFMVKLASENILSIFQTILSMKNRSMAFKIMEHIMLRTANCLIDFITKHKKKSPTVDLENNVDKLRQQWLDILNFIVIDFKKQFREADEILQYLNPLPETKNRIFSSLQQAVEIVKDTDQIDGVSKTDFLPIINHFVDGDMKTVRVEILNRLFKQLQDNRKHISSMLVSLDKGRGFSEDASSSILHRMIIRLLEISFCKGMIYI